MVGQGLAATRILAKLRFQPPTAPSSMLSRPSELIFGVVYLSVCFVLVAIPFKIAPLTKFEQWIVGIGFLLGLGSCGFTLQDYSFNKAGRSFLGGF
ncbi:uncharacterized protein HKW66_Vig0009710 [Vigna angularis]|uniref:Uncharacterized protein n=1 Tax=Phaseolus angularis TaxID=3914 RepID=A0A8T0LDU5_PHAAN|nr:uncharacterized protein HKW66_Vig0009710 [Vigna angularis]